MILAMEIAFHGHSLRHRLYFFRFLLHKQNWFFFLQWQMYAAEGRLQFKNSVKLLLTEFPIKQRPNLCWIVCLRKDATGPRDRTRRKCLTRNTHKSCHLPDSWRVREMFHELEPVSAKYRTHWTSIVTWISAIDRLA